MIACNANTWTTALLIGTLIGASCGLIEDDEEESVRVDSTEIQRPAGGAVTVTQPVAQDLKNVTVTQVSEGVRSGVTEGVRGSTTGATQSIVTGGGGGSAAVSNLASQGVRGVVRAPAGMLAPSRRAPAVFNAAGKTVRLIQVDPNGNQLGPNLATATTDENGEFRIQHETLQVAAGNYWTVVGNTSTNNQMRAMVTDVEVTVDPASEVTVQIVLDKNIPLNAATPETLKALEKTVREKVSALGDSTGTTLAAIVSDIKGQVKEAPEVETAVEEVKNEVVLGVNITDPAARYVRLVPGSTYTFTAAVSGENVTNSSVAWSLLAGSVGTIDESGVYTAPFSPAATDSATVVATSNADSTKSDKARVEFVSAVVGCSAPALSTYGTIEQIIDNGGAETHANGMANDPYNKVYVASSWRVVSGTKTGSSNDILVLDFNSVPPALSVLNTSPVGSCTASPAISGLAVLQNGDIAAANCDGHVYRVSKSTGSVTQYTQTALSSTGSAYSEIGLAATKDSSGNDVIYVADSRGDVIRKIDSSGNVSDVAGSGVSGYADGTASTAQFGGPTGIAVDCNGNLIVADRGNALIRRVNLQVTPYEVTTLAGGGGGWSSTDHASDPLQASFAGPLAVAVDSANDILVSDHDSGTFRKIHWTNASAGAGEVTSPAGQNKPGSPLEYIAFLKNGTPIFYVNYKGAYAIGPTQ